MRDLILLPGWGFDHRVWQPLVQHLGHGFRICYHLDAPSPGSIVCGWSLGGFHALAEAARAPDRIERLILFGATPRFVQGANWSNGQSESVLDSFSAAVSADPATALRRFVLLSNQGDRHAREINRWLIDIVSESIPNIEQLNTGLNELRTTDLRNILPDIQQPTLLIHGDRDPLMPLAAGHWLARNLRNGRIEVITGAAHAPFLHSPQAVAESIQNFINE